MFFCFLIFLPLTCSLNGGDFNIRDFLYFSAEPRKGDEQRKRHAFGFHSWQLAAGHNNLE